MLENPIRKQYTYAAIVGGVVAAGTAVYGGIKESKAKKEAAKLNAQRPQYQISPYAGKDIALAESELGNNNSATNTYYNEQVDRDLSASLEAALKGGATPNNIGDIFDRSAEGRQRYALMNDNLRLNRINNLVQAHNYYNDQQDKRYQLNNFAPWADASQANAAARNAASQTVNQGINGLANAASLYAGNRFSSYFNQPPANNYVPYSSQPTDIARTSRLPDMSNVNAVPSYLDPNSINQLPPLNINNNQNSFIGPQNYIPQ